MAGQKFSAAEREVIWLAHVKKCAYTRELIDVSSFHIDHVVPENLADDPQKFQETKAKLNLGKDFDLTGFGNLLPCKPGAFPMRQVLLGEVDLNSVTTFLNLAMSPSPKGIVDRACHIGLWKNS